jgi:hypothetical protein
MTWSTQLEVDFLEALEAGKDPKIRELMRLYCRLLGSRARTGALSLAGGASLRESENKSNLPSLKE